MLTVSELMTVNPVKISPDTTLRHVIRIMDREGCRQLPVVDEDVLVGIITDRDVRLVLNSPFISHGREEEGGILDGATAEGIMTPAPITVSPTTPAFRAAEMLGVYKYGALPVLENGVLVGIVTVTDYLSYFAVNQTDEMAAAGGSNFEI